MLEPRRGLRILSIRKDIGENGVTRWSFVIGRKAMQGSKVSSLGIFHGKKINDREGESYAKILEPHGTSLFQVWSPAWFYA